MASFPQKSGSGRDRPTPIELDSVFVGVDMRRPGTLGSSQAGLVNEAVNVRFRDGDAVTRGGCLVPTHYSANWGTLLGAGEFSDPDGRRWTLAAAPGGVWLLGDGYTPACLSIPEPLDDVAGVEIVQTFDSVCLFRGRGKPVWTWDGNRFHGWAQVSLGKPDKDAPGFLQPTPPAEFGIVMADRLFVPVSRDEVGWSDVLDFGKFDLTLNTQRFNQGEDDAIVALAPYQDRRLVVFKEDSIYFLENIGGDMSAVSINKLPGRVGCLARRSVVEIGQDLAWLAHGGIYRMSQTETGAIRSAAVPMSEPIRPLIERINWRYADRACGCVVGGFYYLAVPLDNSVENNAVLVYDLAREAWQGVDFYGEAPPRSPGGITFPDSPGGVPSGSALVQIAPPMRAPRATAMLGASLFGRRVPMMVDGERFVALGQGDRDRLDGGERPVTSRVRTRGYHLGDLRTSQLRSVAPMLGERGAAVTLRVHKDGQAETLTLFEGRVRERERYTVHAKADYDLTNAGDDFAAPYREDYLWLAGDGAMVGSGIPLALVQEWDGASPVLFNGRWFAVEIEAAGVIALRGVQCQGLGSRELPAARQ